MTKKRSEINRALPKQTPQFPTFSNTTKNLFSPKTLFLPQTHSNQYHLIISTFKRSNCGANPSDLHTSKSVCTTKAFGDDSRRSLIPPPTLTTNSLSLVGGLLGAHFNCPLGCINHHGIEDKMPLTLTDCLHQLT